MIFLFMKRAFIALASACVVGLPSLPAIAISLEEAIGASLEHSTVIGAARQNWIAIREAIGINTSTSDISARLTSTGILAEADEHDGDGFDGSQSLATGVTLSKNLYDGGQAKENVRLARLNLQIASANYAKTEQSVILATVEAYLNVLKALREGRLHNENKARLEAHVKATKIRVQAGAATPTRLAEANARYARAQSDAILTETKLNNAEDSFRSLTGLNAIRLIQPLMVQNLPRDLLSAENFARSAHPDVLAAIAAEHAANQGFNVLQASVRPTLSFSLSANTRMTNGTALEKDEVAAQLVFSSPLLSTNATRSRARNVAAHYEAAKLSRAETMRKIQVGARQKFRIWQTTAARLDAVLSEIEAFRLVARGIASEAQFGQKTMLDLLDAEKNVNDAELTLVTAEHNQLLSAFRLKAAIGDLTAEKMGIGNVLVPLFDLPGTKNPFQTTFPFRRVLTSD